MPPLSWEKPEVALLKRLREENPVGTATWKYIAHRFNQEVDESRRRSHWSLCWKYKSLQAEEEAKLRDAQLAQYSLSDNEMFSPGSSLTDGGDTPVPHHFITTLRYLRIGTPTRLSHILPQQQLLHPQYSLNPHTLPLLQQMDRTDCPITHIFKRGTKLTIPSTHTTRTALQWRRRTIRENIGPLRARSPEPRTSTGVIKTPIWATSSSQVS